MILNTYDAEMLNFKISQDGLYRVSYDLIIHDEETGNIDLKNLIFLNVCAIDFRLLTFPIVEVSGFYEIYSLEEKRKILEENFIHRKNCYLYHEDYNYDAADEHDILNYREELDEFIECDLDRCHLYEQITTGGVYRILAMGLVIK